MNGCLSLRSWLNNQWHTEWKCMLVVLPLSLKKISREKRPKAMDKLMIIILKKSSSLIRLWWLSSSQFACSCSLSLLLKKQKRIYTEIAMLYKPLSTFATFPWCQNEVENSFLTLWMLLDVFSGIKHHSAKQKADKVMQFICCLIETDLLSLVYDFLCFVEMFLVCCHCMGYGFSHNLTLYIATKALMFRADYVCVCVCKT